MGIPPWRQGPSRRPLLLLGLVLSGGLALRLTLAYVLLPDSGFWFDVPAFSSWALSLAYHGPGPYYTTAGFADYPPGFLLILWPLGMLSLHLAPNDELVTRLLIKLPAILADVLLAFVAWLVIRRDAGERAGLVAASLYIFNPITWFDSAVWGQVDSVGTLVLFLTVVSLATGRSELAALLAALAILIKPQYAIIAPVIAVVLLRRHVFTKHGNPVRIATSLAAGAIPAFAILALFKQAPLEFIEHMRKTADQYPYVSMNAFNPWAIFSLVQGAEVNNPLQAIPWMWDLWPITDGITPYQIGLTLFVLAALPVVARLVTRQDRSTLFICVSALALAFFVLPTRIHERYAFPFFALALPLAATSAAWLRCYVVLSLTGFANIYAVYSLPLLQNAGAFRPEVLDATIFSPGGIMLLSVVNTLGFCWVLWSAFPWRATEARHRELRARSTPDLADVPGWQGGEDVVGVGVKLARGGKLLRGLRHVATNLVRSAQLKSSVRVGGGEFDRTP